MKWFKHMSDLPRDEGVSRYLDKAGKDYVLAYGFLMFVLEAVASRMDTKSGDQTCTATYSLTQWGLITHCHTNRVTKYLQLCEVTGWVHVGFEGSSCEVSVPRMVQWRDEYSRKSGHTPDKVAQSRVDQIRPEERESKDECTLSDFQKTEGARRTPPPDFEITESLQEWAATNYPSVDIRRETDKFVRHEFPTPHTDWDNQWKNWIQNGYEYQQKHNGSSAKSSRKDELLKLGQELQMTRASSEPESEFLERVETANQDRIDKLDNH